MGPRLARSLREHQARQAEHEVDDDDGIVFPAATGGYEDPGRLLRHEHRPALRRAGLRLSLVNHELRHTAAALWRSLGLPLEYVRRSMGHRSIETTIANYGHLERMLLPGAAQDGDGRARRAGRTLVERRPRRVPLRAENSPDAGPS